MTLGVDLPQRMLAQAGVVVLAGLVREDPAVIRAQRQGNRNGNDTGQALQHAKQQCPVCPRATVADEQVVTAGLGRKSSVAGRSRRAVGRDPVADRRYRANPASVFVFQLRGFGIGRPATVDHDAHRKILRLRLNDFRW